LVVVVVLLHLLLLLRYSSPATPPEIPPLCIHRLSIAEPRSFSDSNSYLLLFVTFVATLTISNLAISIADAFCKSLVVLPLRDLLDRSPQNYEQSSPRSPRHFSGSSLNNLCNFSGSSSIFLSVTRKCCLR